MNLPQTPTPFTELPAGHRHVLNKKFLELFVLVILVTTAAYAGVQYWQSQQLVENEYIPAFTPRLDVASKSDVDPKVIENVYAQLAPGNYSIEYVQIPACGDGPCPIVTPGVFAVENKKGGYRIDLSETILKPYVIDRDNLDNEILFLTKVGDNLYFNSVKDRSIHKVDIKEKKIVSIYQSQDLHPRPWSVLFMKNKMVTSWTQTKAENDPHGALLVLDLTSDAVQTYRFNVFDGLRESVRHLLNETVEEILPARQNPDLVWVIPGFDDFEDAIQDKYPVINLKTNKVEYKTSRETPAADQPDTTKCGGICHLY